METLQRVFVLLIIKMFYHKEVYSLTCLGCNKTDCPAVSCLTGEWNILIVCYFNANDSDDNNYFHDACLKVLRHVNWPKNSNLLSKNCCEKFI